VACCLPLQHVCLLGVRYLCRATQAHCASARAVGMLAVKGEAFVKSENRRPPNALLPLPEHVLLPEHNTPCPSETSFCATFECSAAGMSNAPLALDCSMCCNSQLRCVDADPVGELACTCT
jgi:hypothetical protein